MQIQRVNEIEVLLEGVPLPASRASLVRYARGEDGDAAVMLQRLLPDREYGSLDEVGEVLRDGVEAPHPQAPLPVPESGNPPGGGAYLQAFPQPGAVEPEKPPSEVLARQSKTQNKQQSRRNGG